MVEYLLYKTAEYISRFLPLRMAYWVGLRFADQFYLHRHKEREGVISNIRQIYEAQGIVPAKDALRGHARKMYQYFGKYLVDFFRFSGLTQEQIRNLVSIQNLHYLEEVKKNGRGGLIVTAHFGNWELGGAAMAAMGYKFSAVEMPRSQGRANRLLQRQRQKRGAELIQAGKSGFTLMRKLKRGEFVVVLMDRDFSPRNDRMTFFGKEARIPRGPAWLSKRTGVPIVPGFFMRQIDDTFLMKLYPPIYPEQEESEQVIREKLCRIMEDEIGRQPFQWFVFEDFWAGGH